MHDPDEAAYLPLCLSRLFGLGAGVDLVTRLYSLPQPEQEERTPTAQERELRRIRHQTSLVAARLTLMPGRVEWALRELEGLVEALRALGGKA